MEEYIFYFVDGTYFSCYADNKSDAKSYMLQCLPYVTDTDIQSISHFPSKF